MRRLPEILVTWLLLAPAAVAGDDDHWAFRAPVRREPPAVERAASTRGAIDSFVLARLERHGLGLSPEAERTTLIRRLSLDLTGLPPAPAEVDDFLADGRPDALERLIDRLLASPHFGERWGRHWLDLARYADSNGYTRDNAREIWPYRDWVIDALNRDLPFDRFTIEQVAGDMVPGATPGQVIATGFHRNTLVNEEGGTDREEFRVEAVADRLATTGVVFLALTLNCARCHDHKYDPVSQQEYFELFAFLNSCDEPRVDAPTDEQLARGEVERRDAILERIRPLEAELEKLKKADKSDKADKPDGADQSESGADRAARERITARIKELRDSLPRIPTTLVMRERAKPRVTHVHVRGSFLDRGERVSPAVPGVLHSLRQRGETPDRLDLAHWLVDPSNPLTPRVAVNRVWQRLFGRGIVETENDFGTRGAAPTHPALLDWLAIELVGRQWSLKSMIREVVTSATYRQSSRRRPELDRVDPENRMIGRQTRLRMEAEIIRDSALTASGVLSRRIGGPSVHPPQPEGVFEFTQDIKPWPTERGADRFRRGMYTRFWRSSPYPALMVFDFPDSNVSCTRRPRSNTPLQALTLANDTTFVECAQILARRIAFSDAADDASRVRLAFRRCLAREPTAAERDRLLAVVRSQRERFAGAPEDAAALAGLANAGDAGTPAEDRHDAIELAAWTAVARVLLNLDEFVTRE